jgi:hypothetical protein
MSLSSRGLGRLYDTLRRHVDDGACPGLVSVISRRGETHVDVIGDVQRDTIFRGSSMTKPTTRSTSCCPSWPTAGCSRRSTPRSTTP